MVKVMKPVLQSAAAGFANFNVFKANIYHIYSKILKRGIYVVSVCKRQVCLTRSWSESMIQNLS